MAKITTNPTVDYSTDQPAKLYYLDDSTAILPCVGNPEGIITADRGSIASDITTGNLYAKTTNGINTGWTLVGAGGGGGITGGGANGQVSFFNGATSITSESNFAYSTASKTLTLTGVTPQFIATDGQATPSLSILNQTSLTMRSVSTSTDPQLVLHRIRASGVYPQTNDIIGTISFLSSDAVGLDNPAKLLVTATQNHSASVAGSSITLEACLNGSVTRTQRIFCDGVGNVITGLPSLVQAATAGFTYIPSIANTPSGVPSSLPTGFVPLAVDITNFRLYGYAAGAWKNLTGTAGGSPAGITGDFQINNGGAFGAGVIAQGNSGRLSFFPTATSSGASNYFQISTPADTNQTSGTENNGFRLVTNTRNWLAGAINNQREAVFEAPTYSFTGASTITNGATLAVTNAPIAGTNATITNGYSIWSQSGSSRFDEAGTSTYFAGGLGSIPSVQVYHSATTGYPVYIKGNDRSLRIETISSATTSFPFVLATAASVGSIGLVRIGVDGLGKMGIGQDIALATQAQLHVEACLTNLVSFRVDSQPASTVDLLQYNFTTTQTAIAGNYATLAVTSSGTPTNGFGAAFTVKMQDATTANRNVFVEQYTWVDATDATRKARVTYTVYDTAARVVMFLEGTGTAPAIGFLGASAAAQQTGGALTAAATYGANEQTMLQRSYNALRTFGFLA